MDKDVGKEVKNSRNHVLAGYIFEGISHYGFMHASYIISEALIVAIEENLQHVGQYMESRLKKVVHCFNNKNTQKEITKKHSRESAGMRQYGLLETPVWAPESYIKK